MKAALHGRRELVSKLADVDEVMEDLYLNAMMEDNDDKDDGLDRYPQWRYNRRCDG